LVAGSWELTNSANGFVSDSIAVDYDLVEDYKVDAVYFGTVEGTWGAWDGKMYRLVTYEDTPDGWEDPNNTLLIDTGRPIISAASVGYDDENYWVYFGSGRFFDKKDKNDGLPNEDGSNAWEGFYGIKEPMDHQGEFTWAEVERVLSTSNDEGPGGQRNLLRVDQIEVTAAASAPLADVTCKGGGTACLPGGVTKFDMLLDHVVGTGCTAVDKCTGSDGWFLQFDLERERNLGQGALLGGLMTFTTYQPFDDVCKPEGEAFLYGVYFQTGTGWYEAVFTTQEGGGTEGDPPKVTTKLAIGRGLATTPNLHVGRQEGSKAFVQTSTGTIVEIPQPNLPIKTTKSGRMSWRSE
jgi:type IV pilus assembly protein PilY1